VDAAEGDRLDGIEAHSVYLLYGERWAGASAGEGAIYLNAAEARRFDSRAEATRSNEMTAKPHHISNVI